MNTERPTCSRCGSKNIQVDAVATWNYRKKGWELSGVLDGGYCNDCDQEQNYFTWIPIKRKKK